MEVENGRHFTLIQLENNGLGPAMITKVTYTLRDELESRVDEGLVGKEMDLRKPQDLKKVVAKCVGKDGQPAGNRVYLLRHKEVHPPGRGDLTRAELRELLDTDGNKEQGTAAGRVLKADGNIMLLRVAVKEDLATNPPSENPGPTRAYLLLLRTMVNGAVIEVEYTDARGVEMPKFIGVITMPKIETEAAAGAAAAAAAPAVGAGGSMQGHAAGNSSSGTADASGSSSKAADAKDQDAVVLQVSDAMSEKEIRDAAKKMLPVQQVV